MKKKVNCTRKRDLKVDMNRHNNARDMGAKALWGITHPNTPPPRFEAKIPVIQKEATKTTKYLNSWLKD